MSALSLASPFPIFTDIDGNPLEDGYIYVGTAGLNAQTNPIQAYWDAALTVPADQPIRTLGGYPSRSGAAARIYVNADDCSILVKNKNGSLIFSAVNQTLRLPASIIAFTASGAGAVDSTVGEKLLEFVSPEGYGAVGDGVTNDRAAFAAAFAASDSVRLVSGKTYWLGNIASTDALFSFSGANKIIDFNGAKITTTTTGGNYNAGLFELDNIDGFTLINPDVQDLGFDQTQTFKGVTVVRFNVVAGPVRNIRVTGAKYLNVVSSFDVINSADTIENVWFEGEVKDSYYGLNFSNNGHYVTADYRTDNCVRSYSCRGVAGHNINCVSRNHAAASNADFLIAVTDVNKPMVDLKARFVSIDSQATTNAQLSFQSINNAGTTVIKNMDISYDDSLSPLITKSISFAHYLTAGGAVEATDPNQKGPIRIRGNITKTIDYLSAPTSPQVHDFDYGQSAYPSFLACVSSQQLNVTGDGTVVDVVFDSELSDQGGNYNAATGVFTAPRNGLYSFAASVYLLGKTAAETRVDLKIVTTSATFVRSQTNTGNPAFPEDIVSINAPVHFMKAGETAKVQVIVYNGTKIVDIFGSGSTTLYTYFSGAMQHGMLKLP